MRKFFLVAFLLLCSVSAYGRSRLQGYVERGGQTVTVGGFVSSTKVQKSYPLSTVTVYLTGTTTLATIYSTSSGTTKANPFTADSVGFFFFYADVTVDVKFSGTGIVTPWTITAFSGGGGSGGGCGFSTTCLNELASGGLGTSISPWTGWETATNALPINSNIVAPVGFYTQTATIALKKGDILTGQGQSSTTGSVFTSAITGSGFTALNPLPGITQSNVQISNICVINTNVLNTGSGFLDAGGFHTRVSIMVIGFRYGFSIVGSESVDYSGSNAQFQVRAGIWIVNGGDYQPPYADINLSANPTFTTNVLTFINVQINEGAAAIGVIDDGGETHTFINTNFNGCLQWMRVTAIIGLKVLSCQFEAATSLNPIEFTLSTYNSGTGLGPSGNASFDNSLILADQTVGAHAITIIGSALTYLSIYSTSLQSTVAAIFGTVTINVLSLDNSRNTAGGTLMDATPFHLINRADTLTLANVPLVLAPTYGILRSGESALSGGTIVVACSTCTANTLVLYSRKTIGGAVGNMSYTVSAGVSFTLNSSSGTDTSTMSWTLIEKQ